jgi:hypothetical protein
VLEHEDRRLHRVSPWLRCERVASTVAWGSPLPRVGGGLSRGPRCGAMLCAVLPPRVPALRRSARRRPLDDPMVPR